MRSTLLSHRRPIAPNCLLLLASLFIIGPSLLLIRQDVTSATTPFFIEGRVPSALPKVHPWSHTQGPLLKLRQRIQKQRLVRRMQQIQHQFYSTSENQRHVFCQTRFTWSFPTQSFVQEVVFGRRYKKKPDSGSTKRRLNISSMQRMEFNHDFVGRTHPALQLSAEESHVRDDEENMFDEGFIQGFSSDSTDIPTTTITISKARSKATQSNTQTMILANSLSDTPISTDPYAASSVDDENQSWFPPSSFFVNQQPSAEEKPNDGGLLSMLSPFRRRQPSWRVCRYVGRVGKGQECYSVVRDAALNWEFHTNDEDITKANKDGINKGLFDKKMGIIRVRPNQEVEAVDGTDSVDCRDQDPFVELPADQSNIQQLWSKPGAVKLATYTEARPFRNFLSTNSQKDGHGKIRRYLNMLIPSLYAVNPIAVVYDLVDQRGPKETYTCTAYATLKGHLLCGEERITVVLRDDMGGVIDRPEATNGSSASITTNIASSRRQPKSNKVLQCSDTSTLNGRNALGGGYVDVEILSYSRASPSFLGRLVWPLIGGMQDEFFRKQLESFHQVAATIQPNEED